MRNIDCLVWEVTLKCNANCIHCGSGAGFKQVDELDTQQAENVCYQINDAGIKNVNLIGGELFLRKDWKQIIKQLRDFDIKVSIVTNGICLTKSVLRFLADNGVYTIGISIDGGKPETHNYIRQVPKLYEKIFKMVKQNDTPIQFTAITTLNKLNYKELPLLQNKLRKSNFSVWEVQTASPHGRMSKSNTLSPLEYYFTGIYLAILRQKIPPEELAIVCNHDYGYYSDFIPRITIYDKWTGCPAGISSLGIKYNGDVIGCLSLDYKKFREYSILEKPLKEILSDEKSFCWNDKQSRCYKLDGYCKNCNYSKICMGGCSDIACSHTDNIANNPQCFYAIEQHYKNKKAENDFDRLFRLMITGKINDGKIILPDKNILSKKIISDYNLTKKEKALFDLILSGDKI